MRRNGRSKWEAKAAWTEDSAGGPSEAPRFKSPHKARAGGTSNSRQHTAGGHKKVIKTTKRKGSRVLGFETPETTAKTKRNVRQTTAKGDEATEGAEDPRAPDNKRSGQAAIMRKRKVGGFFHMLKPTMEGLLGQLEAALVTRMEDVPGERNEEE
jgi:hypothetical protein